MRRLRYAAPVAGCMAVRHALMNTPLCMQFGILSLYIGGSGAMVASSDAQQASATLIKYKKDERRDMF